MCKLCNIFKPKPEPMPVIDPPENMTDRYAFLVGINRYRPDLDCDLRGCVNDVEAMRIVLINRFGFHPDHIRMLVDDRATKNNMVDRLLWLIDHADSELVFHYSGHGSQIRDRNGDELEDGLDEILCPYDMDWEDPLTDDLLDTVFKRIPDSSFLTMICDSCHSGTMTRNIKKNRPRYLRPPKDILLRGDDVALQVKHIGDSSNHTLISGCRDNQYSADAWISGKWHGALTSSLIRFLEPGKTWAEIFPDVVAEIKAGGFAQDPKMTGQLLDRRNIFGT